jgi:hypothetical protein
MRPLGVGKRSLAECSLRPISGAHIPKLRFGTKVSDVLSLTCRLFSLAPALLRGEGLFKFDNPFQKIPSGGDSTRAFPDCHVGEMGPAPVLMKTGFGEIQTVSRLSGCRCIWIPGTVLSAKLRSSECVPEKLELDSDSGQMRIRFTHATFRDRSWKGNSHRLSGFVCDSKQIPLLAPHLFWSPVPVTPVSDSSENSPFQVSLSLPGQIERKDKWSFNESPRRERGAPPAQACCDRRRG